MVINCCELKWLTYLLCDLRVSQFNATPLFCDNQDVLHVSTNPVFHEQIKHIKIGCHFVRDEFQAQRMSLPYILTTT